MLFSLRSAGFLECVVQLETELSAPVVTNIDEAVLGNFIALIINVLGLERHGKIFSEVTNEDEVKLTERLLDQIWRTLDTYLSDTFAVVVIQQSRGSALYGLITHL
jgi:hypothetical protein